MWRTSRYGIGMAAALLVAAGANGQAIKPNEWRTGTTLAGFVGGTTASESRAATGASIGWELLPRLTIDGTGIWAVPHRDASVFTALLGVRVNITPPRPVVPFVSAGVGFQRASFDSVTSNVPDFYRRRMASAGLRTNYAFDDFAYATGAGADIFVRRHLALRPDMRFVFVTSGGSTRANGIFGVHLAYHFEEHPVTP